MFRRTEKVGLKDGVIDESVALTTVLRRVKVLAVSLKSEALRAWIDSELTGYAEGIEVPNYRCIQSPSIGTFSGPFGSRVTGQMLPTYALPESLRDSVSVIQFRNPISEIEKLAESDSGELKRRWPAEAVMLARESMEMSGDMVLVDAYQPIPSYVLKGIVDAVRNRLLDFLIKLEQVDPEALTSSDPAERVSPERATQIFNYTISGGQNVLAAGHTVSTQTGAVVACGDLRNLLDQVKELGVSDADAKELENALEQERSLEKKKLGSRVHAWLGKMTSKAAEGAWKTTTTAAPQLLVKLLSQYLGLA